MDGWTPHERKRIQRDLARSIIKEPLLRKVSTSAESDKTDAHLRDQYQVIIEGNDEYYLGKQRAYHDLPRFVKKVCGLELISIGGSQNPYFKTTATAEQLLRLVEFDSKRAERYFRKTHPKDKEDRVSPSRLARYLLVRRIWEDFRVNALVDRSIGTVKADAAHRAYLAEGKDIVWAVIDSGIDGNHVHFQKCTNLKIEAPVTHFDFTQPNGDGSTALTDGLGHGTHVAGIIAGAFEAGGGPGVIAERSKLGADGDTVEVYRDELKTIGGMAPSCKLVSLKVLDNNGQGGVSNILAALDKIQEINDHGRKLNIHGVNLSVGYEFDPSWFACGQSPVCVEVNRLVRSGVVVVVAAGNTGYGVLSSSQRETGAGMMLTINDPGNADFAITVGSTHRDAPHTYGVSYFSSKGPTGDGRLKPDLVAPGERILSCCSGLKRSGATNIYVEDSGTSMAAPHVSGVIAAFLSIRREYIGQPEKVKDIFLSTATDLGRERYFQGRGLVDLMRAIQAV